MSACIFCRIVAKEIPARSFSRTAHARLHGRRQVNPATSFVAAKGHAEKICTSSPTLRPARSCARRVRGARNPGCLSARRAIGVSATEGGVSERVHYHMHLVPRREGDGMALTWPAKNPPREKLAECAESQAAGPRKAPVAEARWKRPRSRHASAHGSAAALGDLTAREKCARLSGAVPIPAAGNCRRADPRDSSRNPSGRPLSPLRDRISWRLPSAKITEPLPPGTWTADVSRVRWS